MHVLLIEDHPIIRVGVAEILQSTWPEVVLRQADTLTEGLALAANEIPDIVLLDLGLSDANGVEAAIAVLEACPGLPVVILTASADAAQAVRLFEMGVLGYVTKDQPPGDLVLAIDRARVGKHHVPPLMVEHILDVLFCETLLSGTPHERLSTQEYKVAQLIAVGAKPSEIAVELGMAVKTVGTYRTRILEKSGWKNNIELAKYFIARALLPPR